MALLESFKGKKAAITFHSQADLDAVASACAVYFYLGPSSSVLMQDSMNAEARKFAEKMGVKIGKFEEAGGFESLVLVDCNSKALAPKIGSRAVDLVIDHHERHKDAFPAKKVMNDTGACSACEVLYKLLPQKEITKNISICLLAGIISDSAHLKSANAKTFSIVGDLLAKSKLSYQEMLNFIHVPTDISQRLEMLRALRGVEFERKGEFLVATAIVNSFEAHVASSLVHVGADFAFVAHRGREDLRISARVSGRGKGKVDLAEIMRRLSLVFGGSGGGHTYAAGYDGKCPEKAGEALEMCRELVMEKI